MVCAHNARTSARRLSLRGREGRGGERSGGKGRGGEGVKAEVRKGKRRKAMNRRGSRSVYEEETRGQSSTAGPLTLLSTAHLAFRVLRSETLSTTSLRARHILRTPERPLGFVDSTSRI